MGLCSEFVPWLELGLAQLKISVLSKPDWLIDRLICIMHIPRIVFCTSLRIGRIVLSFEYRKVR